MLGAAASATELARTLTDGAEACHAAHVRLHVVSEHAATRASAVPRELPVPASIQQAFQRLVAVSRLRGQAAPRLKAVDSADPAWVTGAGAVYVSARLWSGERRLDASEIAAVLAHELAHLERDDARRKLCDAVGVIGAGTPPAEAQREARRRMASHDGVAIWMMQRNHRRELAADRRAAELLSAIGLDPVAVARMLVRITPPGAGDYSGTHPAIETRLENLATGAE